MLEYYIFTIFVFILCLLLIFAVKALILKGDKQDSSKDEKLLKLYTQVEEMMESFEEYADDVKMELEDEKKKMLRDIRIQADDIRTENTSRKANPHSDPLPDFTPRSTRPVKTAAQMYRAAADETENYGGEESSAVLGIARSPQPEQRENISDTDTGENSSVNESAFTEVTSNDDLSKKAQIISMHKSGVPAVKIAKKMNMNISEINLIIMKQTKK